MPRSWLVLNDLASRVQTAKSLIPYTRHRRDYKNTVVPPTPQNASDQVLTRRFFPILHFPLSWVRPWTRCIPKTNGRAIPPSLHPSLRPSTHPSNCPSIPIPPSISDSWNTARMHSGGTAQPSDPESCMRPPGMRSTPRRFIQRWPAKTCNTCILATAGVWAAAKVSIGVAQHAPRARSGKMEWCPGSHLPTVTFRELRPPSRPPASTGGGPQRGCLWMPRCRCATRSTEISACRGATAGTRSTRSALAAAASGAPQATPARSDPEAIPSAAARSR
jgi:hypothetical protein